MPRAPHGRSLIAAAAGKGREAASAGARPADTMQLTNLKKNFNAKTQRKSKEKGKNDKQVAFDNGTTLSIRIENSLLRERGFFVSR